MELWLKFIRKNARALCHRRVLRYIFMNAAEVSQWNCAGSVNDDIRIQNNGQSCLMERIYPKIQHEVVPRTDNGPSSFHHLTEKERKLLKFLNFNSRLIHTKRAAP